MSCMCVFDMPNEKISETLEIFNTKPLYTNEWSKNKVNKTTKEQKIIATAVAAAEKINQEL